MQIPKTLKIGNHIYRIEYPFKFDDNNHCGETAYQQKEIRITKRDPASGRDAAESHIEETLWHEIVHCIDCEYNDSSLKEIEVKMLAKGLYQVLMDNFEIKLKKEK